jgi:hypothetical protein
MRKTANLDNNLPYWFFISLFALLFSIGNIPGSIAEEKPASNEQQSKKSQDDKNKKSDEKSISDDDVKLWLKKIEIY